MSTSRSRAFLAIILLLYLALGALFAIYTPPWQAPDEPAHYNYIRYLADKGAFPVLHMGDYPHAYLEHIKGAGFPPTMSIDPIRYEFHQPPLYYALLAPVYALTQGSLIALRLVSVLLGAGVVLLAYAIGRRLHPKRLTVALGTAAFVAFLPQHLATVSQVGNDVLAELLLAAVLLVLVGWVQKAGDMEGEAGDRRQVWGLGFLLGLVLVTKTTAYIAAPLAGVALVLCWWRERASLRRMMGEGLAVILPAVLIAFPWYARNISIYGSYDFLGLQRHDAIVLGQMRAADFVAKNGWGLYWQRAFEWTFKSFVGVFGWMGVWLDSRIYLALAVLGGIAAAGHLLRIVYRRDTATRAGRTQQAARKTQYATRLLITSALLTFLAYSWYNIQFLQHQGRYLFTALIPIGLAFAAGWEAVVLPQRGRWIGALLILIGLGVAVCVALTGAGLPKWPVAILAAAAVAAFSLDTALTVLARFREQGHPFTRRAFRLLRATAVMFPYAFLALIALYALFGAIVTQLTLE